MEEVHPAVAASGQVVGHAHARGPAAHHRDPLRQMRQVEGFVRCDGMLDPGKLWALRTAAGRDQDVFRAHALAGLEDTDMMRVLDLGAALDDFGLRALDKQVRVKAPVAGTSTNRLSKSVD